MKKAPDQPISEEGTDGELIPKREMIGTERHLEYSCEMTTLRRTLLPE